MPYSWSEPETAPESRQLDIWPHRSLSRRGFAAFILITCAMLSFPLISVLGTVVLWGILPFLVLAVAAVWIALEASFRAARLHEALTIDDAAVRLVRTSPRGDRQEWECNRYWTKVNMHPQGGPVANYVTLAGKGREVEIGAFLSEPERKALYDELSTAIRRSHT